MTTLDERLAKAAGYFDMMRSFAHGETGKSKFGDFVAAIEEARKKLKTQADEDERRL